MSPQVHAGRGHARGAHHKRVKEGSETGKRTVRVAVLVIIAVVVLSGCGKFCYEAFHDRGMNKHLDADQIAAAELRMWQAYYGDAKATTIALELLGILRSQFGLSYSSAIQVAMDLHKAAVIFRGTHENYEERVLPTLTKAYQRLRRAVDGKWDAEEVARAELEWWVARRLPEQRDPENVGKNIAHQYALLYGTTNDDIETAGLLRARAARLRDQTARNTDWSAVGSMLQDSYRALVRGIEKGR